ILSEQNTQTGFNLPRRPRRADYAEGRGAEDRSGVTKVGMVEGIEKLASNFGAQPFADTESAQHRKIQVDQARTAHDACSRVAEGVGRRLDEGCGVEPCVDTALGRREVRIREYVRPLRA